jgi:tRNA dimethylallyltransferase
MPGKATHDKKDDVKGCIVVCGPTASGKSVLADEFSGVLFTHAILVDSMQVYREIPVITNQARGRPASLSGIISVTDEWSVAEHVPAVRREVEKRGAGTFVLDAGTGMYLNAAILDIPLAPRVGRDAREEASRLTAGAANPRRASRTKELELSLAGGDERGSIWDGDLTHETTLVYIKPPMDVLEDSIKRRSREIVSGGLSEAELLSSMASAGERINPSVLDSIGVKELLSHLRGDMDL